LLFNPEQQAVRLLYAQRVFCFARRGDLQLMNPVSPGTTPDDDRQHTADSMKHNTLPRR